MRCGVPPRPGPGDAGPSLGACVRPIGSGRPRPRLRAATTAPPAWGISAFSSISIRDSPSSTGMWSRISPAGWYSKWNSPCSLLAPSGRSRPEVRTTGRLASGSRTPGKELADQGHPPTAALLEPHVHEHPARLVQRLPAGALVPAHAGGKRIGSCLAPTGPAGTGAAHALRPKLREHRGAANRARRRFEGFIGGDVRATAVSRASDARHVGSRPAGGPPWRRGDRVAEPTKESTQSAMS